MANKTTRLMVLGAIVYRGPVGGYGIQRIFDEWAVARWTTIAAPSIYQQLRSLSAEGLIEHVAGGETRAAEYVGTRAGRATLHAMLLDLLGESSPQPLSLIPLLHFTPTLSDEELAAGLSTRIARIDEALAYEHEALERAAASGPSHVAEIFRLTWEGLRADRRWCEGCLARLAEAVPSTGRD